MKVSELVDSVRKVWLPPPKMTLSEWADEFAFLSAESSADPGRWKTLPYQRGIMDAISDPTIEQVTVMKSARVGYSKILNHVIGYHIHYDPCPIMVVQPTIEDAEGYSKEEIAPMLRDTPCLTGLVADSRARDSNNTIVQKNFPGGTLSLVGANSPRGFRRVSRRVVLFDEVDGYPESAGAEGDQIKLGKKRSEYYWNRKIVIGSTPTIDEKSRVQAEFLKSDQRRFFVACPHCGTPQYLKWGGRDCNFGIKWPDGDPSGAYYVCEKNGCVIEHWMKRRMIEEADDAQKADPNSPLGWHATATGNGKHAGFHVWAAYSYSPNATWGDLAAEFEDSKDDPLKLQTFINTALGECWAENYTARLGAEALQERCSEYRLGTVPSGGMVLTAGVDTQDNRLAVVVRAWGRGEESWLVQWTEIYGDPADLTATGPWAQVDNLLQQEWPHEDGGHLKILATAVDTGGHFTHEAYMFCRQRKARGVIAVKGSSNAGRAALGKPSKQDVNFKNQTIKGGVELWLLGTNTIKTTIYARMKAGAVEGDGAIHWPIGVSDEYFKQLTAERQSVKFRNGYQIRTWEKKPGARNEALDCEVYNYAALLYLYTRTNRTTFWEQLEKLLTSQAEKAQSVAVAGPATPTNANTHTAPTQVPPQPIRRPTQQARRGGFIKRF